jgi:nucleoside-diphosphate-sugar epimerase
MKILVTGGAGFIGSNLVEELLKKNHTIKVLDNFSTGSRNNIEGYRKDIEVIEGDIRSYHIVQKAVHNVEVIFHLAALPSVPRSITDPITSNEVNVLGTLNLLNAAVESKVSRFIFSSSSSVYGDTPELPKHEGMTPNPLSPYAVSKLTGEKYCSVFSRLYGLETISLRYFNVFGPRQDPNSQYSAVIPKFIKLMINDKQPVIYGDGLQSRDFTFVKNVVNANILAASAKCESGVVMNCACHFRVTLNDLVNEINQILGKNIQPIYSEPRTGDIKHSFADISLAKKLINFEPTFGFKEGLIKTFDYYKSLF